MTPTHYSNAHSVLYRHTDHPDGRQVRTAIAVFGAMSLTDGTDLAERAADLLNRAAAFRDPDHLTAHYRRQGIITAIAELVRAETLATPAEAWARLTDWGLDAWAVIDARPSGDDLDALGLTDLALVRGLAAVPGFLRGEDGEHPDRETLAIAETASAHSLAEKLAAIKATSTKPTGCMMMEAGE